MVRFTPMIEMNLSADELVRSILQVQGACLLDSCGVGRKGSDLLIAGIDPVKIVAITEGDPAKVLDQLDEMLSDDRFAIFLTLSYDLGLAINGIPHSLSGDEPCIWAACFDTLAVHDYSTGRTHLVGDERARQRLAATIAAPSYQEDTPTRAAPTTFSSNLPHAAYIEAIERIKQLIRAGETYQSNLTQQLSVPLKGSLRPNDVFLNLRRHHPAAFSAYLDRGASHVVSASPERFFRIEPWQGRRRISVSPIKGTSPRGSNAAEDRTRARRLFASQKDRAENTMIVDLMRNDLGRICEFGSIDVTGLCRVEAHPTLFHLVSDIEGILAAGSRYSDIIRALFPCGSITGAPKLRTMQILEGLEIGDRGLSMGAIGYRLPSGWFGSRDVLEMSVAIRTMTIRDNVAVFNVGGGIVIDSDPQSEYEESLLKARALLRALNADVAVIGDRSRHAPI